LAKRSPSVMRPLLSVVRVCIAGFLWWYCTHLVNYGQVGFSHFIDCSEN